MELMQNSGLVDCSEYAYIVFLSHLIETSERLCLQDSSWISLFVRRISAALVKPHQAHAQHAYWS